MCTVKIYSALSLVFNKFKKLDLSLVFNKINKLSQNMLTKITFWPNNYFHKLYQYFEKTLWSSSILLRIYWINFRWKSLHFIALQKNQPSSYHALCRHIVFYYFFSLFRAINIFLYVVCIPSFSQLIFFHHNDLPI